MNRETCECCQRSTQLKLVEVERLPARVRTRIVLCARCLRSDDAAWRYRFRLLRRGVEAA